MEKVSAVQNKDWGIDPQNPSESQVGVVAHQQCLGGGDKSSPRQAD